ncbi:hypothetical protein JXA63_02035 [Candidatus Woesebacteria bacterium]|nr:hypothetical protein [Candidatus Woesebacteria bacterium]
MKKKGKKVPDYFILLFAIFVVAFPYLSLGAIDFLWPDSNNMLWWKVFSVFGYMIPISPVIVLILGIINMLIKGDRAVGIFLIIAGVLYGIFVYKMFFIHIDTPNIQPVSNF